jgi:uncharacterized membrane protein YhaH (DUF805 family)
MFKIFFGEIKTGRLQRLAFLGYSLLIQLLVIGFVIAIIVVIGASEQLIGGDLQQAQDMLRAWFSVPFIIVFGIGMALFGFAGFNLMAKRIRDTGLPGWWTLLAILVVEIIVSIIISQETSANVHIFLTIVLLLIPADTFSKTENNH